MKPAVFVQIIAALALSSGIAWSADAPVGLSNPDVKAPERVSPAAITPVQSVTSITAEEMRRLGIVNVADALKQLVPQNVPSGPVPIPLARGNGFAPEDRSSYFIGNTIENLRGMDPVFGGRTLTLVDGRRTTGTGPAVPAAGYITRIRALTVPEEWQGPRLSERRSCPTTAGDCGVADLLVSRPDGSMQLIASAVTGTLLPLPRSQTVFACADSTGFGAQDPAIIDLDGTSTSLPSHPATVRSCTRAGTGSEVLLTYAMEQDGRHYTLARVFDANGAMLKEASFRKQGTLKFKAAGKKYSALVPGP